MGHTGGGLSRAERDIAYRKPKRIKARREHLDACERKTRYASEESCRASSQYVLTTPQATVDRLWVYRCDACRGWHMTSNAWLNEGKASVTAAEVYSEDTL